MKGHRRPGLDRETLTIARGAGVVIFGTLLGSVLRYLFQVAIARRLGAPMLGVFSLGFTIFRWISIIAEIGLLSGVVRYVALFRAGKDLERVKGPFLLALRRVFLSSSGLGLLLFLLASPVTEGIFDEPELAGVLRWFALAIPFTTPATAMLFSTQAFKIMEYTILVKEILSPLGRLLLFLLGGKLYGAAATYAFVAILATGLAYHLLTRAFPPLSDRALRPIYESKEILTFSYPILLAQVLTFANLWMDSVFLGYFWMSQEAGLHSAAQRTAFLSTLIMLSFNAIFAPVISGLCAEERFDELGHHFRSVTKVTFLLRIFPHRLDFLKPLVAGLVPAAVILFLGRYGLPGRGLVASVALVALFALAYLGILLLLGLDQEDRIVLRRLRDRLLGGHP